MCTELKWTQELPGQLGYYFFYCYGSNYPSIVKIKKDRYGKRWVVEGMGWQDYLEDPVYQQGGWWAGPVVPPPFDIGGGRAIDWGEVARRGSGL